jgi:hypothetical protein
MRLRVGTGSGLFSVALSHAPGRGPAQESRRTSKDFFGSAVGVLERYV